MAADGERRVRFDELSWGDVSARLSSDCRVVVPLGATEEHGYLSLSTDSLFVDRVATEACRRADVLMAPTLPFGCSAFGVRFPGTISLRTATMCKVLEDVTDCLYRQGFRRIVVVTGHGGNEVVTGVLAEVQLDRPGLIIHYLNAWAGMSAIVAREEQRRRLPKTEHAAWHEAFEFNRVGALPEGSKSYPESADFPIFPVNPRTAPQHLGDGVVSGAFVIPDPALMEEMLDACIDHLQSNLSALPQELPVE